MGSYYLASSKNIQLLLKVDLIFEKLVLLSRQDRCITSRVFKYLCRKRSLTQLLRCTGYRGMVFLDLAVTDHFHQRLAQMDSHFCGL